jgi:hypothetical protein
MRGSGRKHCRLARNAEVWWGAAQALIKERWRHLNAGLDSLIEQQRGWSVPDPGLRTNLQEVIVEDVITLYREFWKRYEVRFRTSTVKQCTWDVQKHLKSSALEMFLNLASRRDHTPRLSNSLLTSGPFGDSMSAAARPKRWGVSRQAKGREFDPTKVEFFTLLTWRGVLRRIFEETKGRRIDVHKWTASDGSEFVPTTDVKMNLTLLYLKNPASSELWCTLLCKKILTFCFCSELQQAQRYAKLLAPSKKVSYQTIIVDVFLPMSQVGNSKWIPTCHPSKNPSVSERLAKARKGRSKGYG